MRLAAGHYVAERYEIDSTLGSGGMAVVYRAYDMKLDRFVTLKVLKEDYVNDENLMKRFPDEARAAAQLNHQNIVRIFDHGQDGDVVFIVLEYIEGNNLKEHINRMAPFDDETCIGVAIQIAEGLKEAHASGIIHLDIKPQNVLVTTNGTVKVTDFGIARVARDVTLKAGGGSMGSVHYFSPEQARGGYIDHKSDIYSLGIVLFEMVTGQVPFDGDNVVAVAMQQINDPLPDILSFNPNVSPGLVNIINTACEKSSSHRYQSITDMAIDLKRAMSSLSVSQAPVAKPAPKPAPVEEYYEYEEDEYEDEYYEPEPPPPPPRVENKRQIQKKRQRKAFFDNEAPPPDEDDYYFDAPPPNVRGGILKKDENLGVINKKKKKAVPVYTDADKKSDKAASFLGVIAGIVFMALILVAVFWGYSTFFGDTVSGRTPSLIGLSADEAFERARSYGFEIEEGPTEYHPEYPAGYVIRQEPPPGVPLAAGIAIRVTRSRGQQQMEIMENVVGQLGSDVYDRYRVILAHMDFGIWMRMEYSDTVPDGHVISQSPSAGTPLEHGAEIELIVSRGPEGGFVVVPDIVGMEIPEAFEALHMVQLMLGQETPQYHPTIPEGEIISQSPAAGENALRDSAVNFVISLGEGEEVVPTPTPAPTPTPSPEPEESPEPSPAPSPAPTPAATPQPTPTPSPEPTPGDAIRTISIPFLYAPAGLDHVYIRITRQNDGGTAFNVGDEMPVFLNEFPWPFQVRQDGATVVIITVHFLDASGAPVRSHLETINFGASG